MSCVINRHPSTDKIINVKAPNGNDSILYKSLKDALPDKIEIDAYVKETFRSGQIKSLDKDEVALALWSKVYTPTFKQWFGDWEKSEGSKVVDANGEPKVMYHYNDNFDKTALNNESPIYFTSDKGSYSSYGKENPAFLNAKVLEKEIHGKWGIDLDKHEMHTKGLQPYFFSSEQIEKMQKSGVNAIIDDWGETVMVTPKDNIKSIFNEGEFSLSDNIYYQMANEEVNEANPQLELQLTALLNSLDVDVNLVNKITDKEGNEINAYGKADLLLSVIELTNGRNESTLPEETAHMITGLLGKNHPIVRQMMNMVPNMSIYDSVRREYEDVYDNEDDIKFEAVGKLIAENIILGHKNENGSNETFIENWWNRVIRVIGNMFRNKSLEPLAMEMDIFMEFANNIRNGKIKDELTKGTEAFSGETTFYQLKKGKTQAEINIALNSDKVKLSGPKVLDEQGRERYTDEARMVENRVTDKQTAVFNKGKTKEEAAAMNADYKSVIYREVGTELHDFNERILNYLVKNNEILQLANKDANTTLPKKPSYLKESHMAELGKSLKLLSEEIAIQQAAIDPTAKATVHTEGMVIDRTRDIAGSMDVVVVYSDGSVSIYDYKFIEFHKTKIGDKYVLSDDTQVNFRKEESFSLQISDYKKILKDNYGVTHFRATRILPFNIQYARDDKNMMTKNITGLEGFDNSSKKQYLVPLPVSKENTDNKNLNEILSRLFARHEKLGKDLSANWTNEEIRDRLILESSTVKKAIKGIQVNRTLEPLIDSINLTLDNIKSGLKGINIDNIGDLTQMILEVDLFQNIYKYAVPEMNKDMANDLNNVASRLAGASSILKSKREQVLADEFGKEINDVQKEMAISKRTFSFMSQMNQPVFEAAWREIKKATGDTNRSVVEFISELEGKVNNLKKDGDLLTSYRKITNKDGNLIALFDPAFHKKIKDSRESKDSAWFKENYKLKPNAKKLYDEALAQFEKSLLNIGENLREQQLSIWKAKNDLTNDSAWTNKWTLYKYTDLKSPEKHYSAEYKALSPNLKDYYDFLVESNRKFDLLVDDKIKGNFIANIQKDMIDALSQGDGFLNAIRSGGEDFIDSMRVRQNDNMISTGEDTQRIPLLYKDNFMYKDKDGNWKSDVKKKNEDLTNNVILFAEAVYRKHNMTKIKDVIESLKLQVHDQNVLKTDNFGKKKTDPNNPGEFIQEKSKKNAEVFDTLITALVYGKTMQSKDSHIKIGDNAYSTNKVLSNIMTYMSTKSLAFNYISGFGNFAGAYANSYIKGVGGKYYTNQHMWKTHKMLFSRGENDLYNHATEYFNIEKDFWVKEKAAKLSLSALTRNLTQDKWFILQQKGDEFVSNTILISMMQNYGIDENGSVKRLALLPEGSKSLFEKIDRTSDKFNIEGLTNEGFDQFRNMVKYVARQVKGTNTSEDLSMIQTMIGGKAIMHFRNWIAPMLKERFGSMEYTKDVQEWEYGRYNSFMKTMFTKKFVPNLGRLVLDVITLGKVKYKGNMTDITNQYNEYLKENPEMEDKIDINEYIDMRERGIRETIHELKILSSLIILGTVAGMDFDDDGVEDYKQSFASRQAYEMMRRAYLELSFWSSPQSVNEILKAPIPLVQVFTDISDLVMNSVDEGRDLLFGENDPQDKKGKLHVTKKMFPVVKFGFDILDDYNKE